MGCVDSVILNLTERSCRAFQRLTGRTNVWLAVQLTNLSIVVYFIWAVLYSLALNAAARVLLVVFCAALLYGLTQTLFKEPIELSEAAAYRRVANGYRNPRRVRDALLRISFVTLSILLVFPVAFVYVNLHLMFFVLSYPLLLLTTAVLYLLACDPLPPCRGVVKEWLSRLSSSAHEPPESCHRPGDRVAWRRRLQPRKLLGTARTAR